MEGALLNKNERNRLIEAIITYADKGIVPELPRLLMAVFLPIKATLDRDMEKYEKRVAIVRENGKKGGRPKAEENQEKPKKTNLVFIETKENQIEGNNININNNIDNNILINTTGAIAPEEEKKIYEIFFWRNFLDPKAELKRFIDYNQKRKWKALNTPDKRLSSAMVDWQPAEEGKRVKEEFLSMWYSLYMRIKKENPDVADEMLDAGSKCTFSGGSAKIHARDKVRKYIESNRPPEVMKYIGGLALTTSWT